MYRALLLSIVILWPLQGRAGLSCSDMPTIMRVVETAATPSPDQRALRSLYADVQRLQWRVSEPGQGTSAPTGDFASAIMLLAADARRQSTADMLARLSDPRTQSILVTQASALVHRGCPMPAAIEDHADRIAALATAEPEDLSPARALIAEMTRDQWIVLSGLVVLAFSAIYLLQRLYQIHLTFSRYRITRFPCEIPCHVEAPGQDIPFTMININVQGAMLSSDGPDQLGVGQVANLSIGFRSIASRIERRDVDKIAVQFETRLKPRVLFDILEEGKLIAQERHPTITPKRPSKIRQA